MVTDPRIIVFMNHLRLQGLLVGVVVGWLGSKHSNQWQFLYSCQTLIAHGLCPWPKKGPQILRQVASTPSPSRNWTGIFREAAKAASHLELILLPLMSRWLYFMILMVDFYSGSLVVVEPSLPDQLYLNWGSSPAALSTPWGDMEAGGAFP